MFKTSNGLVVLNSIAVILSSMFPPFVAARYLGPELYSDYNEVLILVSLFSGFLIFPIGTYLNNSAVQLKKVSQLGVNIVVLIKYNLILLVLIFSAISFTGYSFWSFSLFETFFLLIGLFFVNSILQSLISLLNYLGSQTFFTVVSLLLSIFSLVAGVFFVSIFKLTVFNWFSGIIFVYGCFLALILFFFLHRKYLVLGDFTKKSEIDYRALWEYSKPLFSSSIFLWILYHSYKLILSEKIGAAEAGMFFAGYGLASGGISLIERFSMLVIHPIFMRNEKVKSRFKYYYNSFLRVIFQVTLVTNIFFVLFGKFLISFLFGENFTGAYIYLIYGLLIESFRVLLNSMFIVYYHLRTTWRISWFNLRLMIPFVFLLLFFHSTLNLFSLLVCQSLILLSGIVYFTLKMNYVEIKRNRNLLLSLLGMAILVSAIMSEVKGVLNYWFYLPTLILVFVFIKDILGYIGEFLELEKS